MAAGKKLTSLWALTGVALLGMALCGPAVAQLLDEDFETVTESGGGVFLFGPGVSPMVTWDDGIVGEGAIGEATGLARVQMSAQGLAAGGVEGGGAGELAADFESLNMIDEDFEAVTGTGGGVFLTGDGFTPNMTGSITDWDDGIENEDAYCVTRNGAVLNGEASAQGLTSGGIGGGGGGQLVVTDITTNGGSWYGALRWTIPGFPGGAGALVNPGFELGGWDTIYGWEWWADTAGSYPSLLIVSVDPQAGAQHIKVWGRASGRESSGIAQNIRAEEGQTWELDCWTEHVTGDSMAGSDNYVEMRIEFYDGINPEPIGTNGAVVLDGSSPLNVWIDNTPIQATAPAGTLIARAIIQYVDPSGQPGAAFIDTASFHVVSGPPAFDLSDYSLTADVKGEANTAAGEAYGHYQLRIEDSNGDRLVFESAAVADGNWTTIGGTLDQAIEKNADDVPATGVFNVDSATLRVVVIFDPSRNPSWGTGGTLSVDNLVLTNDRPDGSDYSGALTWADLPDTTVIDPRYLMLTADVKGDVGGNYELRLDGFVGIPNVDEDFSVITANTEVQIAEAGDTGATIYDWNAQLENDAVFFGMQNAAVTDTGGIWVRALTTGGYGDDGSCVQIEALDVWPQVNGFWYAGMAWRDQLLPSTDLQQVTLTAKVKGTWNTEWLQEPAKYVLRIEDPDGDWIGFEQVYDGTYQSVGGALSDATTSGLVAQGNGMFDVDTDLDYRVVVVYSGRRVSSATWGNWGGTLTIDDVYLSPSPNPKLEQAGSVTFSGVADGTFQSVGGLLTEGQSTWPPDGGQFYPQWTATPESWDVGLEGETAFAGFGWGASIETASAEGCKTCGVSGTGGGVFTVTGIASPPGWYWAGVAWPGLEIDMSNLSQTTFTIDAKGVWNPAAGETPGMITIRLQDENGLRIAWDSSAVDGSYHTLGGALNTFTAESGFDLNSPSYTATIIVYGYRTPSWGKGATVYFDNVTVSDPGGSVLFEDFETVVGPTPGLLTGMDAFAVTLAMQDGVFTWPAGGSLIVDNLKLTTLPRSCDIDQDIDLAEFAALQACYTGQGGGVPTGCACSDVDGDDDVDLADYSLLYEFFTGPQ